MRRVGIKYCGGCNPDYDRVALVEELKNRLAGYVEFVAYDAENIDMVLAVEGCQSACADLSSVKNLEVYIIKAPADAERFISFIRP
ncbi:MAG: hypothetical protein KGY61_06645 [Desulfobacterales bacterium]|nr:hypothetical protein [Desulfobacterales bacterium]